MNDLLVIIAVFLALAVVSLSCTLLAGYYELRSTRRMLANSELALDLESAALEESERELSDREGQINLLDAKLDALRILWLVGQYRFGDSPKVVWDFQGVFADRATAEQACRAENWFMFPVEVGAELPEEAVIPEIIWPKLARGN